MLCCLSPVYTSCLIVSLAGASSKRQRTSSSPGVKEKHGDAGTAAPHKTVSGKTIYLVLIREYHGYGVDPCMLYSVCVRTALILCLPSGQMLVFGWWYRVSMPATRHSFRGTYLAESRSVQKRNPLLEHNDAERKSTMLATVASLHLCVQVGVVFHGPYVSSRSVLTALVKRRDVYMQSAQRACSSARSLDVSNTQSL